ncbi:MAG TPA: septum formation inhibitor Maf [Porticoccaceae bacterium]|nr:septum formation inhibitor Maf [Porticoccaceae bacterium]HCO58664.1 septum formation inhibitor Maf [Porticoccaceae bacterium]
MQLVLASSSPYRKQLLERLQIPFECQAPGIDENALSGEAPSATVLRLAREKAQALHKHFPEHLIIGSDQLACHGGRMIGKPGKHERALSQLLSFSGQTVEFLTSVCVYNSKTQTSTEALVSTEVSFRTLDKALIENYLRAERPYDCAGSFKAEGLGIALFEKVSSDDPTALMGLPLIQLCEQLAEQNFSVLSRKTQPN